MAKVSTEAQIGKILILIEIILGVIGLVLVGLVLTGSFIMGFFPMYFGALFGGLIISIIGIATLIGLILDVIAYKAAEKRDFHKAGIYALIAGFVPPFRIVTLIAGILCLISPEAKSH